jgi:hypothetical protein
LALEIKCCFVLLVFICYSEAKFTCLSYFFFLLLKDLKKFARAEQMFQDPKKRQVGAPLDPKKIAGRGAFGPPKNSRSGRL